MTNNAAEYNLNKTTNPDPKSGVLGAHPVGTGLGAVAGGAASGALAGTVAGPVGTAAGAVAGAVAGGFVGKKIAKAIDPTAEEAYWRENYSTRSYVTKGASFDEYGPAYRYGVDAYGRSEGGTFERAETELKRDWDRAKGASKLTWENAKHAARDSWHRVSNAV